MEEKEYEALNDMFATAGWKLFIEQLKELEQALVNAAPDNALTNDQWQHARGQIQRIRVIIGFENYVKLAQEEEKDAVLFDEGDINVDLI